jgi:hypothetical protein
MKKVKDKVGVEPARKNNSIIKSITRLHEKDINSKSLCVAGYRFFYASSRATAEGIFNLNYFETH